MVCVCAREGENETVHLLLILYWKKIINSFLAASVDSVMASHTLIIIWETLRSFCNSFDCVTLFASLILFLDNVYWYASAVGFKNDDSLLTVSYTVLIYNQSPRLNLKPRPRSSRGGTEYLTPGRDSFLPQKGTWILPLGNCYSGGTNWARVPVKLPRGYCGENAAILTDNSTSVWKPTLKWNKMTHRCSRII